eukprot:scaffold9864_cov66-Skeletonema_marinoi.AAC.2
MADDGWYIYYGRDGEVIPWHATRVRIDKSLTVIPARAFYRNQHIEEVEFNDDVETVEEYAFRNCPSLRRVIMRGVKIIENDAFGNCKALTDVESGKLERIGRGAFYDCESLRSINLTSAKIVGECAFFGCKALTTVKFGKELESIEEWAFYDCTYLERITIPLKDGMITDDDIFQKCEKLKSVDLVEGEVLRDIITALQLEEWKNEMDREMSAINQILPSVRAGSYVHDDVGEKALAIRRWISLVLRKIIEYKAHHRRLLNEAATTLQHNLHQDIVMNNVLPFLKLPSYTFEGEDQEGGGRRRRERFR